jgi:hypothetical protein
MVNTHSLKTVPSVPPTRGKSKAPYGIRFHDTRHPCITELAESKAGDATIRAIAGRVSKKMLQHYSHVRLEARRTALDALSVKPQ